MSQCDICLRDAENHEDMDHDFFDRESARKLAEIQAGMFGTTSNEIDREVSRYGAQALLLSYLSDAQELVALGRGAREAERLMNRAKYIADTHLQEVPR